MTQQELPLEKGEKMEELLRNYFLELGFYVVRGIKYRYQGFDITDVDLMLYNRPTPVTRERINVDIKNKKTPAAIERIFWTKGLRDALRFENCIVATTDKRPTVREFGTKNNVTVIDGNLLSKLPSKKNDSRLGEEEFMKILVGDASGKSAEDWKKRYEESKSRLLSEMDYSGCNSLLRDIKYFMEVSITNPIRREAACRLSYVIISHLLVVFDHLSKETSFLELAERAKRFEEGIKYGNLGRDGLSRTVNLAVKLTGQSSTIEKAVKQVYDNIPVTILTEFFVKPDSLKSLFKHAKEFEGHGFAKTFSSPNALSNELQSILAILLDYHKIERKGFFNSFEAELVSKNG